MRRTPWRVALRFGVLHGMGCAGALREIGLPAGEIPMALFSFNVGIELGQLAFVIGLVLIAAVLKRIELPIPLPRRAAVYSMCSFPAFCTIERVTAILLSRRQGSRLQHDYQKSYLPRISGVHRQRLLQPRRQI